MIRRWSSHGAECNFWSLDILMSLVGARRRRNGSGPGEISARMPVATHPAYLLVVSDGNHIPVRGLTR
jgi:hypothetical protein